MGSVRKWIAAAVALSSLQSPTTFAKGSNAGAQLDTVSVDASVHCNRVFFNGTEKHKGTVFFMPRVDPGTGDARDNIYDIARGEGGKYILTLRLFFPQNEQSLLTGNATSSRQDQKACNLDSVKLALNSDLPDSEKITRIAPAPLTSIEVAIKGIQDIGTIGRTNLTEDGKQTDVDVLDYYGKVRTVEFRISEQEMNYFNSSIVNGLGLPATVKFSFQVRALDGSVSATLNVEELKKRLLAAANGQAYMVKADVTAALKSALDRRTVSIVSEAGSEEANKIMQDMITNATTQFSLAIDKEVADDAAAGKAEAVEGKISVNAAIELLSNKVERTLTWRGYSTPEKATHETEIQIQATKLNDYNVIPVKVQADYQAQYLGVNLKAGKQIAIAAHNWYVDDISFKEKRVYLTHSQMSFFDLGQSIPLITDPDMVIKDVSRNGVDFALGKMSIFFGAMNSMAEYRWVLSTQEADRKRKSSGVIKNFKTEIQNMPVALSFSAINDRRIIPLKDVLNEKNLWNAYFDNFDRLVIKANVDLGDVIFRENMSDEKDVKRGQPLDTMKAYMVYSDPLSSLTGLKAYPAVVLKTDNYPIILQKTYLFSVVRPEAFESGANSAGTVRDNSYAPSNVMQGPEVPLTTDEPTQP